MFEIKDSGNRREFNTGAVRDTTENKGSYYLLPPHAIHRMAQHFQTGGKKYSPRNWEKGMPLSKFLDSALRHLFAYLGGSREEDHIIAAAWNALCFVQTEYWIKEGKLPKELDDVNQKMVVCSSQVWCYPAADCPHSDPHPEHPTYPCRYGGCKGMDKGNTVEVQSKGGPIRMMDDANESPTELPTAREMVDTFLGNIDTGDARAFVRKQSTVERCSDQLLAMYMALERPRTPWQRFLKRIGLGE